MEDGEEIEKLGSLYYKKIYVALAGALFGVHGRKRNIVPSWESRDRDVVWNEGILCQPFGNELLFG